MRERIQIDIYSPIFAIAQAAELSQLHPQTLRQYDRIGLVCPSRTSGNTRRYCMHDINQLREITRLSAEGLSLEGIKRVLTLENRVTQLQQRVQELENKLRLAYERAEGRRIFAAGTAAGEIVSVRRGTRLRRRDEIVIWHETR